MSNSQQESLVNVLLLAGARTDQRDPPNSQMPVCLTEINNKTVIEHLVANAAEVGSTTFRFAFHAGESEEFHLQSISSLLVSEATHVMVENDTRGSACTALLASCDLNTESELLILSANEFLDCDYAEIVKGFRARKLDAATVCFESIQPRYSYVELDDQLNVTMISQHKPISRNATAGFFWFKRTSDFVDAAKDMIRKDVTVKGSFFIGLALNEMLLKDKKVGASLIEGSRYYPLKTQPQIENVEAVL